ncbi:MAG: hypothetical protein L0271_22730 [Gemmatimonadetes bacterium]|nr:hypothetical protein [Gemmatimonadota bacterium]
MRAHRRLVLALWLFAAAWASQRAAAQDPALTSVACRDRPCAVVVDWTREGGYASQVPDRRYGNPADLERLVKARLTERGFTSYGGTEAQALRILLVPHIGRAMCDEIAGTATDMSCTAIVELEARADGPDEVRRSVDLPSRIRNRCASEKVMPIDRLSVFIADWIIYALDGKASGERRPVARC